MQYLAIGLFAGVLSGMFGIGGGIVIVPLLMLVAKLRPEAATGTSLAALLLPVGALGAWQYYKAGVVHLHMSMWIALGLALGAWAGASFALKMPEQVLQRAFALFLAVVAVRLWWTA